MLDPGFSTEQWANPAPFMPGSDARGGPYSSSLQQPFNHSMRINQGTPVPQRPLGAQEPAGRGECLEIHTGVSCLIFPEEEEEGPVALEEIRDGARPSLVGSALLFKGRRASKRPCPAGSGQPGSFPMPPTPPHSSGFGYPCLSFQGYVF